ncbi:ABC transporter ATP-binding protein [Sporichthya brevicatena]|uniref:ABC transporter ATP-binding protein n=1 Tax=Sporichthya brevicatena TaxID=171442 RepID=A0ABN1GIK4_9ACTN
MFELRRVSAGYGGHVVLRDVTLKVPPGSVVALLGANGAGKTTLLRVASGLVRPFAGQLLLDDRDVTGLRPHRLVEAGVCHVPEGRGVFPSLTVRDNLRMHCLAGREEEMIAKAIDIFPSLGRRIGALAGTMSGGEQQMLALARAYIQNPRLALLDEVSMGLAPVVVDEIFRFLEILAKEGASLLLVEQYVTRALAIADYVYLLNRGEVRFVGEPDELEGSDIFKEYVGVEIG